MQKRKFLSRGDKINSQSCGELEILEMLGIGSFGEVYKVKPCVFRKDIQQQNQFSQQNILPDQIYALKIQYEMKEGEKKTLESLRGRVFTNVVQIVDFWQQQIDGNTKYYILQEFCHGDLYEEIKKQQITEQRFRYVIKEIANGIRELHDLNIIHRDIKPENVLLFRITGYNGQTQTTYKICDLGLAKNVENQFNQTQAAGTPYYMAPEQYTGTTYGPPVDVWALGAMAYELMTKVPLFSATDISSIYNKIVHKDVPVEQINQLPLCQQYKELITSMLKKAPEERPKIEIVISKLQVRVESPSFQKKAHLYFQDQSSTSKVPIIQPNIRQVCSFSPQPKIQCIHKLEQGNQAQNELNFVNERQQQKTNQAISQIPRNSQTNKTHNQPSPNYKLYPSTMEHSKTQNAKATKLIQQTSQISQNQKKY